MSKQIGTEETGLSVRTEFSSELAPTSAQAEKQFEIQSAIIIANKFPRNELMAFQQLSVACKRLSFAEQASYSFPRGGAQVTGPSVHLARGAARVWKNLQYGVRITRDDDTSRQIQAFAWDLETNVKVTAEDDFGKLIYRKKDGWVKPDERDLRELTNRRGSILVRNCILQILPKDLIEDAREECAKTIRKGVVDDPESARKRLILAFSDLNITPVMLEELVGHPLAQCSPAEIQKLREVYTSIKDGNSTWKEYTVQSNEREVEKGSIDLNNLRPGTEENRGHGNDNLDQAAREKLVERITNTDIADIANEKSEPAAESQKISACSDEIYSQMVDKVTEARDLLGKTAADKTIQTATKGRTLDQLNDEEATALIATLKKRIMKGE